MPRKKDTKRRIITLEDVSKSLLEKEGLTEEGVEKEWDFEPVNIITFCTDPYYLGLKAIRQNVLDDLVHMFGKDPYRVSPVHRYAIFSEAPGTGKTYRSSIAAIYLSQKHLCLHDPIGHYNKLAKRIPGQPTLETGTKIATILMSVTRQNARKVIYSEVGNKILNCPWFMENYPPNPNVMTERQFDPMPEKFQDREDRIYKNVYIIPGSSSEYSAVGYSIIMAFIDEATLFEDTQDKSLAGGVEGNDQAEAVYETLDIRIDSRFKDEGLLVIAGNPKHEKDFLERHAEDKSGEGDAYIVTRRAIWHSTMPDFDPETDPCFYFHLDTLKIVPEEMKDNTRVIPVPDIASYRKAFEAKPAIAKRNLAGYPSSAVGRVIKDPMLIYNNIDESRENPIKRGPGDRVPNPPHMYLKPWFKRKKCVWHGLHIDLAENRDRASLALAHVDDWDEQGNPIIYLDLLTYWEGTSTEPINQDWIIEWIDCLHDDFFIDIGELTADRHESSYIRTHFENKGFNTGLLSVDTSTEPYDELIHSIRTGRHSYYNQPIAINELTNLESHIKNGKVKYDHSRKGSKDLADAWSGATYNALRCVNKGVPRDRAKDGGSSGVEVSFF